MLTSDTASDTAMMAPTIILLQTNPIYLAVKGSATAVLNWFAALWHSIKEATSWIYHLPIRLADWIAHLCDTMIRWLLAVCEAIFNSVLIFVKAVVAILVLVAVVRIAIWLWGWSKRSNWTARLYRLMHTMDHQQSDSFASRRCRCQGSRHCTHPYEPVAADFIREHLRTHEYGTFGHTLHADTRYQQEQDRQRTEQDEHHYRAPRSTPDRDDTNEQEANVKRQQAQQKAAQAAQEQRQKAEHERRRANARQKLSRAEDERTYQRWQKACDEAFEAQMLEIPPPPTWPTHRESCKPLQGSVACTCSVARLLSTGAGRKEGFRERQKEQMRRWHPDKLYFTSRPGRGPSWVEELFKAIQNAEEWRY